MNPFIALIVNIIDLIWLMIVVWFIMNLLIQFNIMNARQPLVRRIYAALEAVLTPLLRPIQRVLPSFGGVDFSPVVLILLLNFVQNLLIYYLA
ncbi:MAG: YggT family protein [Sphaerospermopsis sp. SIO1G2]|nr:YggT family protein [Sphaerospermopsis sp. SIO1G2]